MKKTNTNLKLYENGLFFLSLGGIGEIGANCYLYCCDGKWIMIDLGLSFADEQFPGVDLLVPKIKFIEDGDVLGVVPREHELERRGRVGLVLGGHRLEHL